MIKKIKTKGMTCTSCEKIIERTAMKLEGVKSVKSDYANEITTIEFDEKIGDFAVIKDVIEAKGYECCSLEDTSSDDSSKPENSEYYNLPSWNSKYILIAGGLLFLLGLFWIVKNSISFEFPTVTPGMGLALIFVVGILTSFHCIGMCGGFVLSYTTKDALDETKNKKTKFFSHLKYGAGKTITYVILGALFGLLGSFITFTPKFKGMAALIAGLFLIVYGLNMMNLFPWLRKLQFRGPKFLDKVNSDAVRAKKGPFMIGLLNGLLLACGPLQAMLIFAAGTGSVIQGSLAMLAFGLGTLPLMLGFGSIATVLGSKFTHKILKVSALIVVILGVVMVNRGLTLTGSGYDVSSVLASVSAGGIGDVTGNAVALNQGYQEIRMEVNRYGWEPDKFVLEKGVPVKWIIDGKEITGCNNAIQVPKLDLNFDIEQGEQIIEFTPEEEGVISWSCWMGMIPGTFVVKDGVDINDNAAVAKELEAVPEQPKGTCGGGGCGGGGCGCGCGG